MRNRGRVLSAWLAMVPSAMLLACIGSGDGGGPDADGGDAPDSGVDAAAEVDASERDGGGGGSDGPDGSTGSDGATGADGSTGSGTLSVGVPCDEAEVSDADMTLDNRVSDDIDLAGLVHVPGDVLVTNAVVTIAPGTTFIMDADSALQIGWNSSDSTLRASGTAELPIRFCGRNAMPGYWGALYIGSNVTSDSVLEHVTISHGGGVYDPALQLLAEIRVTDVRVESSGGDGVEAAAFARDSARLSVVDAEGVAVVVTHPAALSTFPLGGTFEGNGDNTAHLRFGAINVDTTVRALSIPYLQEGDVTVRAVRLSFEAGVDYRFGPDAFLDIGWNNNATELQVQGEEATPVVFQGGMPTKGYWRGMSVGVGVLSNSTIAHAQIMHAGALDTAALRLRARITLDGVALEDNSRGVAVEGPLQPGSQNLSVTGTEAAPVVADFSAVTSLPEGGSYVGNSVDEVVLDGTMTQVLVGTVPDLGVPYHVVSNLSLRDGSDLTIAPGTEFIMGSDVQLEVAWNNGDATLTAVGTPAEPIAFVGAQNTAGFWTGVLFNSTSSATCQVDYVTIANAGVAGSAALRLRRALPVTNSTFRSSAGAGIQKAAADATDYNLTNAFMEIAQGNVITD